MAKKRRGSRRRSSPAAIVVRTPQPIVARAAPRRRRVPVIVGRVRRKRAGGGMISDRLIGDLLGVAAGAAVGWAKHADKLPNRIGGIDAPLAIAGALAVVPLAVKGKVGRVIGDVAAGVGAVAAYRLTLGVKAYSKDASEGEWDDDE